MKTTHFIAAVGLAVGYLFFPLTTLAQPGNGQPQRGELTALSVEESARRKTEMLQQELGLSQKQYKKVYKLYLKQARKAESANQGETRPSGMSMNTAGGGGRPGGGGMGPGGGPPSGGGGRTGSMGGGRPGSAGGGEMTPGQGMVRTGAPRASEPYIEPEKDIEKRASKMKNILSSEQFRQWQVWEREDLTRQATQFMNRSMGIPGQPGDGEGPRPQRP